jgi:hypothetical protein
MSLRSRIILVDTNVIIEAHRTNVWPSLTKALRLETVGICVMETQTGAQNRRPEQRIDEAALRASLRNVHEVSERDRAIAATRDTQIGWLDAGERELWAHAIGREDVWLLCGPDAASLRVGIRLGFRERLTALEALCTEVGCRPALALKNQYSRAWLEKKLMEMAIQEGRWP